MSDKSTEQIFWELDAFIKCSVFSPPEDAIQNAHGLLAALRQRHAEAVEQAFMDGYTSGQVDGYTSADVAAAWLASSAKQGLEMKARREP